MVGPLKKELFFAASLSLIEDDITRMNIYSRIQKSNLKHSASTGNISQVTNCSLTPLTLIKQFFKTNHTRVGAERPISKIFQMFNRSKFPEF